MLILFFESEIKGLLIKLRVSYLKCYSGLGEVSVGRVGFVSRGGNGREGEAVFGGVFILFEKGALFWEI